MALFLILLLKKSLISLKSIVKIPLTVFLNTCKVSLGELVHLVGRPISSKIFGFNGFPTFLNRDVLEVSLWNPDDES